MHRLARIATLWNWLPSFRAVAETESVHEAARQLGMSPSSLSRMVGLLEQELERPLFERGGRGMHLTDLGRDLLEVVRAAMRAVDDVTAPVRDVFRIAAAGDVVACLITPLVERTEPWGDATVHVSHDPDDDPGGRLLRGTLDLALLTNVPRELSAQLVAEPVATLRLRLFIGAAHAERADHATWPQVVYHALGGLADTWPADRRRAIALTLPDLRDAARVAAHRRVVVVLPDELAAPAALVRVPGEPAVEVTVFALRRRTLGPAHLADAVVGALRDAAQASAHAGR